MHPRHSRRSLRLAIGALLLAPALTSCGFNYATDRINAHTAGTTDHSASVDVLNALVVAAQPNSGSLVGMLSNNDDDNEHVLTSITGPEDAPVDFDEVEIPPGGAAQLADAAVRVDGSFEAGDVIDLTLTFDNGEEVALDVPVVPACGQYEGMDDAPAPTSGAEDDDESTSSADAYSCEPEEAPEH